MDARAVGDAVNHAYQAGGDEFTLRQLAVNLRARMDCEHERASFTDAVEMCGLWLDPTHVPSRDERAWCDA